MSPTLNNLISSHRASGLRWQVATLQQGLDSSCRKVLLSGRYQILQVSTRFLLQSFGDRLSRPMILFNIDKTECAEAGKLMTHIGNLDPCNVFPRLGRLGNVLSWPSNNEESFFSNLTLPITIHSPILFYHGPDLKFHLPSFPTWFVLYLFQCRLTVDHHQGSLSIHLILSLSWTVAPALTTFYVVPFAYKSYSPSTF